MQWKNSDIGLLVFYSSVINVRFVAVSTVTGLGYVDICSIGDSN